MKKFYFILGLNFLLAVNLFGQAETSKQPLLDTLDADSQTNVLVIRNEGSPLPPCPPEYTNLISNTNLFSAAEQILLHEIVQKYKDVTTNSGPAGSILVGLNKDTNGFWVANFQQTNSDVRDEITFSFVKKRIMCLNKNGDGYGASVEYLFGKSDDATVDVCQFKHNLRDGLIVSFYNNGHCLTWMRFSNGLAIGKWLEWNSVGGLTTEVEFRTPYDFERHYHVPMIQ